METTDLRSGPPLHDKLLSVLPLVGTWSGSGTGVVPSTGEQFAYEQQATFSHDGRPFLAYNSRARLVDGDGAVIRLAFRESGFWRPGAGEDDLEVVLAAAAGLVLVFDGIAGDNTWELRPRGIGGTPTAREVAGERRLYALRGEALVYATELAVEPGEYKTHLNARLQRANA